MRRAQRYGNPINSNNSLRAEMRTTPAIIAEPFGECPLFRCIRSHARPATVVMGIIIIVCVHMPKPNRSTIQAQRCALPHASLWRKREQQQRAGTAQAARTKC